MVQTGGKGYWLSLIHISALTLKDALEILQLDGLPSVDELDEMFGNIDEYEADEKRAFYAIARMVMCLSLIHI